MVPIACPRCGHIDTFTKGFLPDTCVCRVCQSQLDWREIPGMGPGCSPLSVPAASAEAPTPPASPAPPASGGAPAAAAGTEE